MPQPESNRRFSHDDWALFLLDKGYSLATLALRLGIPAYTIIRVAEALAGKTTLANIMLSFAKDNSDWLQYLAWAILALWALAERWLRRQKTQALHRRILECEKRFDPKRSSSNLTEAGDTNPIDR